MQFRYPVNSCVALLLVFGGVSVAKAVVLLNDNFDGYADQAAFQTSWTPIGCTGQGASCTGNVSTNSGTLSADTAVSLPNSVLIVSPAAASPGTSDNSQRNQKQFPITSTLAIGAQVVFSYDFYDLGPNTVYRQFANLQTVAQPTLTNQLVAMGINNTLTASSDGGDRYMARILGYAPPAADPDGGAGNTLTASGSFFKMNDTAVPIRTAGWHNLKTVLSTNDGLSTDYKFYIDNVLAETVNDVGSAATIRQYEFIRLGAGVSSATDAYYDNMYVEFIDPPAGGVQGDYNGNGVVDGADYVVWRKGLAPLPNEVAGVTPGTTTSEDYDAWRARFGNTSGSGAGLGTGAVPEPASMALLMICASALAVFRRYR